MDSKLATKVYSILPERDAFVAIAFASFLIYYVTTTFLAWRRLRHFPGPPTASISYLWAFLSVIRGRCDTAIVSAQKKYGKAVRISPNGIMIYDPETFWQINSARSAYGRSGWYGSAKLHPEGDSVLSEMDTARHDKRKANLVGGFSGKRLASLEASVDDRLASLVNYIRRKVRDVPGNRVKLNFSKIIRWWQLDLVTLVAFGVPWGDLADETDHYTFLSAMDSALPFIHSVSMVPFLRMLVFSKFVLWLAAPKVTDKEGMGRSIREMRETVDSHFENPNETKPGQKHPDMLGEWIAKGHDKKSCELDLAILMPAGTETSVTVIRGVLLHILSSPTVYQQLKQDIADGIKDGRISRPITNGQAKAMPYLQAVINEGMRMTPPVINGFAKKVPPGGDTICGKFVPEGTEIHANYVSMLNNPEVFGDDSDLFRPERFLECDKERRSYMLKTVDLAFGYGRWLCLGKPLAVIELNKIFVELLRAFDFQICNAENPWRRKVYSASVMPQFDLRFWENSLD
ncbi:hypothetical protein KVR01_009015 [Diaporthe batatas]|uniref:uncharacterized protein n=1 Tax=Diaporthe batatas TaxID=748121 RepID=UPI001D058CA0|nr:uncharacterized protein KVR01_009015 [Diaporthe batatas]KAG8160751.1 hypothetical protein KVR01_009015 [Diaporthe batatas]